MRKALLTLTVLAALLAGAMPAQAGSLSWTDPADDAVVAAEPSEGTLDIVKSSVSTDATKLRWSMTLKEGSDGNPSLSAGYFFVFEFSYAEVLYDLRVKEDPKDKAITLRDGDATVPEDLPCKDCKYTFDRKTKTVSIEVPIASLAETIKGYSPDAPPFKKGVKVTGLLTEAYRSLVAISLRADDAPAPEGTEFTI
jgi:hypothetical protein